MLKLECTKEKTQLTCGGSTLDVVHHALCAVSAIHNSLKDNLDPEIVSFFEKEAIKELRGEIESPVTKSRSEVRSADSIIDEFERLREELEKK